METYILLIMTAILPTSWAYVNCKMACLHCARSLDPNPEILEVYCSMCQECRERRRERVGTSSTRSDLRDQIEREYQKMTGIFRDTEHQNMAEDECPTPPPCETSEEDEIVELKKTTKQITTTTTTTTTERTTCRPIQDTCRRKKIIPCMPCMPMLCMPPCPEATTTPLPPSSSTMKDFYYIYVGVPNDLMKQD